MAPMDGRIVGHHPHLWKKCEGPIMYAARKVFKGAWNHEPFSCLGLMEGKNSLTVCLLGLARSSLLNPDVAVGPYRYTLVFA
jgi:hypothetical protein